MNIIIGTFRVLMWAVIGLAMVLTGGAVLILGILALIGRAVWYLTFEREQGRSVSVGPYNTPHQGE